MNRAVAWRELRSESRNGWNYLLRLCGAGAVVGVGSGIIINYSTGTSGAGAFAFGTLNAIVFCLIWLIVPILTADCISRERREGTLGLLLLTLLKGPGIIMGKSLIHSLRARTLLLTALPVMALCLLMGGVTVLDVVTAFTLDIGAMLLALGAGLIASSCTIQWLRAIVLAEILSAVLATVFTHLVAIATAAYMTLYGVRQSGVAQWTFGQVGGSTFSYAMTGPQMVAGAWGGFWGPFLNTAGFGSLWSQRWAANPPAVVFAWYRFVGAIFLANLGLFALAVIWTSERVKRTWREEPLSGFKLWVWRIFCTPRFLLSLLRTIKRRRLDRNPVGWLQRYSWSSRLTTWAWTGLITLIDSYLLLESDFRGFLYLQSALAFSLLLGMSFTSASSFHRDRQLGALELLLVSPLTERQIVLGRLCSIWSQFIPAVLILFFCWHGPEFYGISSSGYLPKIDPRGPFLVSFAVLPIFGLYFALQCSGILSAWFCTFALGVAVPRMLGFYVDEGVILVLTLGGTIVVWASLIKRLQMRRFPLARAG